MRILICVLVLFITNTAFADVTVIYKVSDKKVVGKVFAPHSVKVEIDNLTKSELGGTKDDYATATITTLPRGHVVEINADGTATTKLNPEITAKRQARQRAAGKLEALGLTREEVGSFIKE